VVFNALRVCVRVKCQEARVPAAAFTIEGVSGRFFRADTRVSLKLFLGRNIEDGRLLNKSPRTGSGGVEEKCKP
jgi:hypothetical protein